MQIELVGGPEDGKRVEIDGTPLSYLVPDLASQSYGICVPEQPDPVSTVHERAFLYQYDRIINGVPRYAYRPRA